MKIIYIFILFFLLSAEKIFSQDTVVKIFHLKSLPAQGVLLNNGWKYHSGDDPKWAKPEYDDSKWEDIDPTLDLYHLPQIQRESVGWLRIKLHVDSSLINIPLVFQIYQSIASEIYMDGKLLQRYGTVSSDEDEVRAFHPHNEPAGIVFKKTEQVLSVRFSVQQNIPYLKYVNPYYAFRIRINDIEGAGKFVRFRHRFPVLNAIYTGLFIVLTIIHLGLFLTYRKQKANLFFSIATLSGAIANGLFIIITYSHFIAFRAYLAVIDWIFLFTLTNLFLFIAIHSLFSRIRNIYFWVIVAYSIMSILLWGIGYREGEILAFMLPFAISMFESLRIAWNAYRKGLRDSGIIVFGIAWYLILYSIFILLYEGFIANINIGFGNKFTLIDAVYQLAVLGVPIALSLYLSRDFAFTSKELEKKLSEVQQLSAEKHQILVSQNETLEQQVGERTEELSKSLRDLKSTQSQLIQSEKMASLGELTAGIAHEIQNPLNFVNNFSDVNKELLAEMKDEINKGNLDEVRTIANDVIDNEEKINHHGKRADAIVKNMLQHSRSSSGVKEPTDINKLADEYLRLAYHGLRAKDKSFNATMKTNFDESIGKINLIPQDIGRVILNLVNNAFYAVTEKKKSKDLAGFQNLKGLNAYEPTVTVSTKKIGNKIELKVADNGNGISQKALDKIFQPFYTTKPTGQGTGLGLSLSYDIIKAHGGEIKVNTKEGEGSEFMILLPA